MIILIKLFLNSKLDLIRTAKFVKQLFGIQIQGGGGVLLWNRVKSRMEASSNQDDSWAFPGTSLVIHSVFPPSLKCFTTLKSLTNEHACLSFLKDFSALFPP